MLLLAVKSLVKKKNKLKALIPCISVNQCSRHNLGYKQKTIQFIRRNQVYFSSSNVSTDTTVIDKD